MLKVCHRVRVVVLPAGVALAERVESDDFGLRGRLYELYQFRKRQTAPFRNPRPALNTVVHRRLFPFAHRPDVVERQLHRIFYQAAHTEPVILEFVRLQRFPFG